MQSLLMGSSRHFDLPALDGDLMGRAYPNLFQVLPGTSTLSISLASSIYMFHSRLQHQKCVRTFPHYLRITQSHKFHNFLAVFTPLLWEMVTET